MNKEKDVWIFDVCGTLYTVNTTFAFLEFFFQKHDESRLHQLLAIKRKNFNYLWRAVLFRFFNIDIFKKLAVSLLDGFQKALVEQEAEVFLNEVLSQKKIEKTNRMLKNVIHSNSSVLLASNSLEPIVKAIAIQNGVEYVATTLTESNGTYTGEIERDLTGRKHDVIDHKQLKNYHVVTDNKSDYQLVKRAHKKFVLIGKNSDRKFWDKLNPEYITT